MVIFCGLHSILVSMLYHDHSFLIFVLLAHVQSGLVRCCCCIKLFMSNKKTPQPSYYGQVSFQLMAVRGCFSFLIINRIFMYITIHDARPFLVLPYALQVPGIPRLHPLK